MGTETTANNEKVLILIDGSNIFHAINSVGTKVDPYRIDYQQLLVSLEDRVGHISKQCYFSAEPPTKNSSQSRGKYNGLLRRIGLDVRLSVLRQKTFKCKACDNIFPSFVEKGVDVAIAVEALKYGLQGLCDAVVLVTGSGVYVPIVEALQGAGVFVAVAAFKDHSSVSLELTTRADTFINLSELVDELRLTADHDFEKPAEAKVDKNPYAIDSGV